jgi:DnaK suppressor protein
MLQQLDAHQEGRTRAEHARDVLLQDGDDAPQRDADREVDMALTDRDTAELAALQQALQRLQAGTYGRCHDCGADIPHARLLLEPQALRCVTCEARASAACAARTNHASTGGLREQPARPAPNAIHCLNDLFHAVVWIDHQARPHPAVRRRA